LQFGGSELVAEAPQPVSNPTKAMPVTTKPFMGLVMLRDLQAAADVDDLIHHRPAAFTPCTA
jgi:hypothetical protein